MFHHVLQVHHRVWCAIALLLRWVSYVPWISDTSMKYEVCMSPALIYDITQYPPVCVEIFHKMMVEIRRREWTTNPCTVWRTKNRKHDLQIFRLNPYMWLDLGKLRVHFAQFWMHRLQSRLSPQYCTWSKWNVGGLYRGHCRSNEPEMKPFSQTTMTIWGEVNGIVNRGAISRKWPCYPGVYLGSGES